MTKADWLFQFCYNLQYINFKKYKEIQSNLYVEGILDKITDFIVICLDENMNNLPKFKYWYDLKLCPTLDCSGDWRAVQKRYYPETNSCVPDCSTFKYENNYRCYSRCPEGADFCEPEIETTANIIETTNKNIITTNIQTTENAKIETTNIETSIIVETTYIELTSNLKEENIETSANIELTTNQKEEKPKSSTLITPIKIETKTAILLTDDLRLEQSDKSSTSYLLESTIIDIINK